MLADVITVLLVNFLISQIYTLMCQMLNFIKLLYLLEARWLLKKMQQNHLSLKSNYKHNFKIYLIKPT